MKPISDQAHISGAPRRRREASPQQTFTRRKPALIDPASGGPTLSMPPVSTRLPFPPLPMVLLLLTAMCALAGCQTNLRVTDSGPTASEQFLMSQAAEKAVAQLSFESLHGRDVFMDTTYYDSQKQPFILGEVRARCFREGIRLVPARDKAQIVLEVRSGAVGIDRHDFLIGIPSLQADVGTTESNLRNIPLLTPELALVKNIEQRGYANVAFVAYWVDTSELVSSSGPFVGRTFREDWWFFGFGPRTVGDIPPANDVESY